MEYRLPAAEDEEELREMVKEYFLNGEFSAIIDQSLFLKDTQQWVEKIHWNHRIGSEEWGKSDLLLCFDEGKMIGMLCIRSDLCGELENLYGNIGYSVRPSERRKGYGTCMMKKGLSICREYGRACAVAGCHGDNVASSRILRKCGGRLADIRKGPDGKESMYFLFDLYE